MNVLHRCPAWGVAVAVFIGPLMTSLPLRAEDRPGEASARASIVRDKQVTKARELIDQLRLTCFQARKLIPLAEQAAEYHLDAAEQQARLMPDMIEAFTRFAEEDRLNQGFSRDVERATSRMNHRGREIRDELNEQLVGLEDQALKILTKDRRQRIDGFDRPRRHADRDRRFGKARAGRRAQRREEGGSQRLREAREELAGLHRQRYPQVGPVGRYLLHPLASEMLCEVARVQPPTILREAAEVLEHGTSEYPREQFEQQTAQVAQLRTEINNWNLINGLHLTQDQINEIVTLYDQAVAAPKLEYAIAKRRAGMSPEAAFALEQKVEQVLNTGQRRVLAEYNRCLIPPKNLKDPVRVGQASDYSRHEKWLDRARKMSREQLTRHIDSVLEWEAEHLGEPSRSERQKRVAVLRKTVRQAANIADVDYELSKTELAQRIAPTDRKQELRDEIGRLARQHGQPGVITQFMLNPQFVGQLRVRGQPLAEALDPRQTDLAKGPQAENCEESCAIDGKRAKSKKSGKKD